MRSVLIWGKDYQTEVGKPYCSRKFSQFKERENQWLCFLYLFLLLKSFTDKICTSSPGLNWEGIGWDLLQACHSGSSWKCFAWCTVSESRAASSFFLSHPVSIYPWLAQKNRHGESIGSVTGHWSWQHKKHRCSAEAEGKFHTVQVKETQPQDQRSWLKIVTVGFISGPIAVATGNPMGSIRTIRQRAWNLRKRKHRSKWNITALFSV